METPSSFDFDLLVVGAGSGGQAVAKVSCVVIISIFNLYVTRVVNVLHMNECHSLRTAAYS